MSNVEVGSKFPWAWVIGGSAAVAVVGTVLYFVLRKPKSGVRGLAGGPRKALACPCMGG